MSLQHQLRAELDRRPAFSAGQETVTLHEGTQTLRCELAALDTVGCACDLLSVSSTKLAGASVDRLKAISETITARLTYLLEPICLLEVDADRCALQLRSNPPQQGDDGAAYYELVVERGGQASLRRYRKPPGQPRQPIAAHVTREVLLRLAGDLEQAMA